MACSGCKAEDESDAVRLAAQAPLMLLDDSPQSTCIMDGYGGQNTMALPSRDIRQVVVGSMFQFLEAFLALCRDQTSHHKLLLLADVKEVAACYSPGKRSWGAVEAVIPDDPHRYVFWLVRIEGHLRIAGVEGLTAAEQAAR